VPVSFKFRIFSDRKNAKSVTVAVIMSQWRGNNSKKRPRKCPRCGSYNWDLPKLWTIKAISGAV